MKNGVLSNFTRSHISSDRVRSGYEITLVVDFPRDNALGKSRISALRCLKTEDRLSGSFLENSLQSLLVIFTYLSVILVFPRLTPRDSVKDRGNFGSCCYLSLSDNVINSIQLALLRALTNHISASKYINESATKKKVLRELESSWLPATAG